MGRVVSPCGDDSTRARRLLGQLLAAVERGHGPGRGKKVCTGRTLFYGLCEKTLKLEWPRAVEAQRIGTLPDVELERAFACWHQRGD